MSKKETSTVIKLDESNTVTLEEVIGVIKKYTPNIVKGVMCSVVTDMAVIDNVVTIYATCDFKENDQYVIEITIPLDGRQYCPITVTLYNTLTRIPMGFYLGKIELYRGFKIDKYPNREDESIEDKIYSANDAMNDGQLGYLYNQGIPNLPERNKRIFGSSQYLTLQLQRELDDNGYLYASHFYLLDPKDPDIAIIYLFLRSDFNSEEDNYLLYVVKREYTFSREDLLIYSLGEVCLSDSDHEHKSITNNIITFNYNEGYKEIKEFASKYSEVANNPIKKVATRTKETSKYKYFSLFSAITEDYVSKK